MTAAAVIVAGVVVARSAGAGAVLYAFANCYLAVDWLARILLTVIRHARHLPRQVACPTWQEKLATGFVVLPGSLYYRSFYPDTTWVGIFTGISVIAGAVLARLWIQADEEEWDEE